MIRRNAIDVVFTTGGYIAAPAILAARWCGIPVVLHESNAIPGRVTRLLGRFCSAVAVGLPAAANSHPRQPAGADGHAGAVQLPESATVTERGFPQEKGRCWW